jgi:hypothetical protein
MDDDNLQDILTSPTLNRLWLFTYLIPVFGMVPAVWTLTRRGRDRRYRPVSRLALRLGGMWLLGTLVFNSALSATNENGMSAQMTLLLLNSLFTSSYFVVSLGLMARLLKRQSAESFSNSLKLLMKPSR